MRTKLGVMTALLALGAASGVAGLGGVAGCSSRGGDDAETAPQSVTETRDATIHSLVALEGGCTAIKVGPKHLLTAARCVTNKAAYAVGKKVRFISRPVTLDGVTTAADGGAASDAMSDAMNDASAADAAASVSDAGAAGDASADARSDAMTTSTDAGADDAGAGALVDAGPPAVAGLHEETIARVEIHPSYLAKCGGVACQIGKTGGGDVADVAVIIMGREVADIPTAPIDLDAVAVGDALLVVAYGCEAAATSTVLHGREAKAASAKSVIFTGSPYEAAPEQVAALASSYVVTLGPGATPGAMGLCADRDFGAPLLRGNGSAVVGVASNVTFAGAPRNNPTTNAHARVDATSRYTVGAWLGQLGVATTRSCSTTPAGCPKTPDAGGPTFDAGGDADEPPIQPTEPDMQYPEEPSTGGSQETTPLPSEKDPTTKKRGSNDGCSATPSSPVPSTAAPLLALAALAFLTRRRRP